MAGMDDKPATRTELLDALAANKADIIEAVRAAQTEVLKAFFSYPQLQGVKFQHLEADLGNTTVAMRERMDILEQRLAEIYDRILPIPPVV